MTILVAKISIKPGEGDAFEAAFATLAEKVRATEDTLTDYRLVKLRGAADDYMFIEAYKGQEAFETHSKNPETRAEMATLAGFFAGRPEVMLADLRHDGMQG